LSVDREGIALRKSATGEPVTPIAFESLIDADASSQIPAAIEKSILQSPTRRRNLRLRMGSGLVRYKVVPWHDAFTDRATRLGFARHCFIDTFGEAAQAWDIQMSSSGFGQPSLAAAISADLILAIEAMAQRAGVARMSIEPELCLYFQRFRTRLPSERLVFVVADSVRLTLLLIVDGKPVAVQVAYRQDGPLSALLERQWQAYAMDAPRPPAFVVIDGADASLTEHAGVWQVTVLSNKSLPRVRPKRAVNRLKVS
jgi:hypothetical protein